MSNGTLTSAISSFILEIMCPQNAQHSVKEEVGRRKWKRVRCGRDRERESGWVGERRQKRPKTMLDAKPNLTIVCAIVCNMFVRC